MRHHSLSQPTAKNRRQIIRKLATMSLLGLILVTNTGCRSGGGGLTQRLRDCRLNPFRHRATQTVVAATDPCCTGSIVTTDPCATGTTIMTQPGAIIQTTPSAITYPSGTSTPVPDLAPIDNKPTSNLDARGANFNRPITSTPETLQAQISGTSNVR
ncbi:MAG: hypothetical protein RJA81_2247 [Planctomycetota bacterium]